MDDKNLFKAFKDCLFFFFLSFFFVFCKYIPTRKVSLICRSLFLTYILMKKITMEWIYTLVHNFLLYIYFILIILITLRCSSIYVKQALIYLMFTLSARCLFLFFLYCGNLFFSLSILTFSFSFFAFIVRCYLKTLFTCILVLCVSKREILRQIIVGTRKTCEKYLDQ